MQHNLSLIERDEVCLWHPFTQKKTARAPIPIVKGKGAYLYDEEGNSYLDGISSWWVNLHGHTHPFIAQKIKEQAEQLEHVLFAGFTHPPAIELAERLLPILPGNMSKLFYSDNGSTAVEAALKMAFQYWHNGNPETKKRSVVCFKDSYHGDTFGAMSAAGPHALNRPFWKHLFPVQTIDPPFKGEEQKSLAQLAAILCEEKTACFIFEPLVLGVGGMKMYQPEGLDSLLKLCREYGVLSIADEVFTGFGRTGNLFACDSLSESPDIICLSKGLTGGFLPLGATACKQPVFDAFLGTPQMALLHGHSYTANPLSCTAAIASLELLLSKECFDQMQTISAMHRECCLRFSAHPKLKRCESLGTLLALEYSTDKSSYFQPIGDQLERFFIRKGILLRPLGNVLYVLPPYCIQADELERIYKAIELSLVDGVL